MRSTCSDLVPARRPPLPCPRISFVSLIGLTVAALGALAACRDRAPVRVDSRPPRVVCLTPSSTEVVAALGGMEWIVGVDTYSHHPPEVRSLPKLGDFLSPNLDAILALTPDIAVLDAVQAQAARSLQAAGITVVSSPMHTIDDVRAAYLAVGAALGRREAGEAAARGLDRALDRTKSRASEALGRAGRRPRVLFVVDRQLGGLGGLVAAGPGTYLDELLAVSGAENVLADSPVRYARIDTEEVLRRRPDVILDAVHTGDVHKAAADWSELAGVPAVATGRVHVLGDPVFVSPGPRLPEALDRLFPHIWGDAAVAP